MPRSVITDGHANNEVKYHGSIRFRQWEMFGRKGNDNPEHAFALLSEVGHEQKKHFLSSPSRSFPSFLLAAFNQKNKMVKRFPIRKMLFFFFFAYSFFAKPWFFIFCNFIKCMKNVMFFLIYNCDLFFRFKVQTLFRFGGLLFFYMYFRCLFFVCYLIWRIVKFFNM